MNGHRVVSWRRYSLADAEAGHALLGPQPLGGPVQRARAGEHQRTGQLAVGPAAQRARHQSRRGELAGRVRGLQREPHAGQAEPDGDPVAAEPGHPGREQHVGVLPRRLQEGGVDVPQVPGDQPDEADGAQRAAAAFLPPLALLRCHQELGITGHQLEAQPAAVDEFLEDPVGGDRHVVARAAQRRAEAGQGRDIPARPDCGDQDPHCWPPSCGAAVWRPSGGAGRRVAASNRPATSRP